MKKFNTMAETDDYPREITTGVLANVWQTKKTSRKSETYNTLIFVICMLKRINDKIDDNISNRQAAYKGRRSKQNKCLPSHSWQRKQLNY